jgi:hypothetical protein
MKFSESLAFVILNHSFVKVFIRPNNFSFTLGNSLNNLSFVVELFWRKDNTFSCLLLAFLPATLFIMFNLGFEFSARFVFFVFYRSEIVFIVRRTYSEAVLSELFSVNLILTASYGSHTK